MKTGLAYPKSPGLHNHRALATYCLDPDQPDDYARDIGVNDKTSRRDWKKDFYNQFNAELSVLTKRDQTIIFSSEHLQSRLQTRQSIEALKALISRHCSDITILVYLRRQDQVAVSRRSTALRSGHTLKRVIPPIKNPVHGFYNYLVLVNRWSEVFGQRNIHVRLYSREDFQGGDLISDFCAACGAPEAALLPRPERQNEALSDQAQSVLLTLNEAINLATGGLEKADRFIHIRRDIANWLATELPGESRKPSRQEALTMYSLFRDSNNELARRYLNRETLFPEDFDIYPENSPRPVLEPEITSKVIAILINVLEGSEGSISGRSYKSPLDKMKSLIKETLAYSQIRR